MAAFEYGGLVEQVNSVVAAGGTTTLVNTSKQLQVLTLSGSNGQTFVLPNATTMSIGQKFEFYNNAAGSLTVNYNGGTLLQLVSPGSSLVLKLTANGTALGTWSIQSGSGSSSGSGSKNYLSGYVASTSSGVPNAGNGNFQAGSTTGWSLAHSALSSFTPTSTATAGNPFSSVSGGTPASANLSFVASNVAPLAGTYSGILASSTASVAGDMLLSDAFYIDKEDFSKVMGFTFYYSAGAGTFNFSGTNANSFAVWIYDVTNGAWIQPQGVYDLVQGVGTGICSGTFQTTSNSSRYQIALININAFAAAYNMQVDDFSFGPQLAVFGPPVSDWAPYTPTGSWLTNTTYSGFWRRIGDSVELDIRVLTSGAPTAAELSVSIPAGLSIDTSKLTAGTGTENPLGVGIVLDGGLQQFPCHVVYFSTTTIKIVVYNHTPATYDSLTNVSNVIPITFGNTDAVQFKALVPIVGWSSNTQMSADTDTRVVQASVRRATTSQAFPATTNTKVQWNAINSDSNGTFDAVTNFRYTIPVSGTYLFTADLIFTAAVANLVVSVLLFKNGSSAKTSQFPGISGTGFGGTFSFQDNAVAGDFYEVFINPTSAVTLVSDITATGGSSWNMQRLCGPAVVAATETVAARYSLSATTAITGTPTVVNFGTKIFDTHNAVTTGAAWHFTVPVSGLYQVSMLMVTTQGTGVNDANCNVGLYRTAVFDHSIAIWVFQGANSVSAIPQGTSLIHLNAGDLLDLRIAQTTGNPFNTLAGQSQENWVNIQRVGN